MAVAASITLNYSVTGLATGARSTPTPITITASAPTDATSGQVTTIVLANGDNTITVPSTLCTACIIQFASASTTVKKIKGAGGDTGIIVSKVGTVVLQFDTSAPASFIINSAGADTGNTTEIVFI